MSGNDQGNGGAGGDGGQGVGRRLRQGAQKVLEGAQGLLDRMAKRVTPARAAGLSTGGPGDDDPGEEGAGSGAGSGAAEGFETETMADLYAAQGLTERAARIYRALLDQVEPSSPEALALVGKLARVSGDLAPGKVMEVEVPDQTSSPMPATDEGPGGPIEPWGLLDWHEMPHGYEENLIVLMSVDPEMLYCYFEVTAEALEGARVQAGAEGHGPLILRLHRTVFGPRGIDVTTSDHEVHDRIGTFYFRVDPPGGRAQVAIGIVGPDGRFGVAAHSEPVLLPAGSPSPDLREEWMEVAPSPPRRDGAGPWPVQVARRGPRKGEAPPDNPGRRAFWSEGRWLAEGPPAAPPPRGAGRPLPFPARLIHAPDARPLGASEAAPPLPPAPEGEEGEEGREKSWRFLGASDRGFSPGPSSPWGGGQ